MAKKKEESTNEKIVRLYKEGYTFDEISREMAIPKGNVVGIVEKYFPDYKSYVQPEIDHAALEAEAQAKADKAQRGRFGAITSAFKGKEHAVEPVDPSKLTVNLEMDENGFVDRTVQGIAQMLKKRSVAETAEFFNKDKADIQAIADNMEEHFRRQEASQAAAAKPEKPAEETQEEPAKGKKESFPTGIEEPKAKKSPRSKYTPPSYTKRSGPKPVSQTYGMPTDDKPITEPTEGRVEHKFKPSLASSSVVEEPEVEESPRVAEAPKPTEAPKSPVSLLDTEPETKTIDLTAVEPETKTIDLTVEAPETHSVKLVPDAEEEKAPEVHQVSLFDDIPDEVPEIPSIEPVSPETLEKELKKAPEPVEDIPAIGEHFAAATTTFDNSKEDQGMNAIETMRQFAQEQIAKKNQQIEELKAKKTDAENDAFDCNTKVEAKKKQIEEMQQELLKLVAAKDAAAKIVSDINDEIEAINQDIAEFSKFV